MAAVHSTFAFAAMTAKTRRVKITAASHLQRARGDGYKTLRTEGESMKDLMQAMADCKNAILSVLHSEKIGVNELDELIKEADKKQMEFLDVKLHKKPERRMQLG